MLSEFEPSDVAALEVLRATGIDVLEAALVAKTALEAVQGAGEEEGAEHHAAGVRGVSAGAFGTFGTPRQRNKARLILSGVFNTAIRCGWCAENPVRQVKPERVEEKRISILCGEEGARLMSAAEEYKGGSCLAATANMLYAGVRPNETARLRWKDVRLDAGVISISPQHSKTGGARCVTIHPPLARILRHAQKADHERICPPN